MITLTLQEIISNYEYDQYCFESIEEYLLHWNVASELTNYCIAEINTLLNSNNKESLLNELLLQINNTTCILQDINNKSYYYIIHKCTKENNTNNIQCSYFKNDLAISDFIRADYKSILENLDINNLKLMEVIS